MLNIDYWKMIADILVDHNPKEFYWFVAQMTREYTTAMLPVLTAEYPTRKVCPYMLIDLATVLDVNLIIYDLGFPLQYKRATAVPLLVILDFQTIMLFSSLIIPSMLQVTESNSIVGVIFCYKKSD
jgi:hypothetical protein